MNEIALTESYTSTSYFITIFKKLFDKTPKQHIMDELPLILNL
ncbi:AraC family transcriptional regulator [Apibacter mensalis]